MPVLYFAHALAAGALVVVGRLPRRARATATMAVCALAGACGVLLAIVGGDPWRTTSPHDAATAIAGAAIAGAWLAAAVLGPPGERWRTGALVGSTATGLALFAANDWVVPALLFWLASSVALVALTARRGQTWAALWIVAGDAAVAIALLAHAGTDSWRLPATVTGWPRWLLLGAAIVRAGAIPRVGSWQSLRSSSAAALPLAAGGAFVVVDRFVGGPLPWAGVGLLAGSVVVLVWSLWARSLVAATVGAWPALVMLAAAAIAPAATERAGIAACLGATLVALWPSSAGRARVPRGFALAFLPPFIGFGAVTSAAVVAFDRAASAPTSWRSAPWTTSAAILPLAVAGGALLGLNAALQSRAARQERAAAFGTWLVAGAALVVGFADPGGAALGRVRVLYAVATLVGLAAVYASVAAHHADEIGPIAEGPDATRFEDGLISLSGRIETAFALATGVVAIGTGAAVLWLAYEGLRTGFLS